MSIVDERWDGKTFAHVIKVQMAYEGRIEGRKAPSYPAGTNDFERVAQAVRQLNDKPDGNNVSDRPDERGAALKCSAG